MASVRPYINHLLQNSGITPACSEEERVAAEDIAKIFSNHGFEPEIQEFSASSSSKIVTAALGIAAFLGAVLMGIGGVVGVLGLLLALAAAVVFTLERMGKTVLSGFGAGGLSQNVIAYHKASGPLASPRNRPVVVVAHYDSPRSDVLCQQPYVSYRPVLVKLLPMAMVAPAVIAVVRLLPVPDAAKIVLWILAIVVALVPLANAVAVIMNKAVLPYTSGAVCNKSSVAAMLGVMDAVAPFEGENEFPGDVPFEDYFAEQRRIAEEIALEQAQALEGDAEDQEGLEDEGEIARDEELDDVDLGATASVSGDVIEGALAGAGIAGAAVAAGAAAGATASMEIPAEDAPEDEAALGATASMGPVVIDGTLAIGEEEPSDDADVDSGSEDAGQDEAPADDSAEDSAEPAADEASEDDGVVNALGNYRYGADVIHSLGMVGESCVIEYVEPEPAEDEETDGLGSEDSEIAGSELEDGDGNGADRDSDEEYGDDYGDDEDYPFEEEYEEDAFEDMRPPRRRAGRTGAALGQAAGLAGAFSAAKAGASRLFGAAVRHGKGALDAIEDAANSVTGSADGIEEVEEEIISTDEVAEQPQGEYAETADAKEQPSGEEAEGDAAVDAGGATRAFDAAEAAQAQAAGQVDLGATVAQEIPATPAPVVEPEPASESEVETVDSLMAQISVPRPAPRQMPRVIADPLSAPEAPAPAGNRSVLLDLPDPSESPADPFAPLGASAPAATPSVPPVVPPMNVAGESPSAFETISPAAPVTPVQAPVAPVQAPASSGFEVIGASDPLPATGGAVAPVSAYTSEKRKRGIGGLFGRKKKTEQSMSDYLGVGDDFDAKKSGRDIGSWDNFEDDDWKGGARGPEGATEEELRDAITSMGDDELLGHDIWFVATGASECGNAGMKAFLDTHRDKLRGVFLINLECVGAGQVMMVSTEGERRVLKGDKRIKSLVSKVSSAFHHEFGAVDMPYVTTDAHVAMDMSLRSLTIAGVDGPRFACSHTEEDAPYNVDVDNINIVADVVTEVIRRS